MEQHSARTTPPERGVPVEPPQHVASGPPDAATASPPAGPARLPRPTRGGRAQQRAGTRPDTDPERGYERPPGRDRALDRERGYDRERGDDRERAYERERDEPGAGRAGTVHQAAVRLAPVPGALARLAARLPRPRLTALGSGLLAAVLMALIGGLDALLLDGEPVVYGVFFVLVCTVAAAWVRPAELITAPIAAPIAFGAGLFFISDGATGVGGHLMALFSALAVNAGWLYAGTLTSVLIVFVRKVLLIAQRARERVRNRREAQRPRGARAASRGRGHAAPAGSRPRARHREARGAAR